MHFVRLAYGKKFEFIEVGRKNKIQCSIFRLTMILNI